MGLVSALTGLIRSGPSRGNAAGIELNSQRDLMIAQGLPSYTEMARQGRGWSVIQVVATAGLVVRPSATAAITLWNGENGNGRSYVIDRIFTHNLVSTATQGFFGMWACIHPSKMALPTADLVYSRTNWTGNSGRMYNGAGVADVGATVINDGWYPWGQGMETEAAGVLPGSHISVNIEGRLIVPPGGAISLQVVTAKTSDTFTSGISWYEVDLPLD